MEIGVHRARVVGGATTHDERTGRDVTKIIAKAQAIKAGRKIMVFDVTVEDQNGKLLGEGLFSYMPLGIDISFEKASQ